MRKTVRKFVGVVVLLALGWLAGPLWAGYQLRQGVRTRDLARLEAHVDWPLLRANLKPKIATAISDDADNSGVIGGTLKRALGSVISGAAVDVMVTPANLRRLLAGRAFVVERSSPSAPQAGTPPPPTDPDAEDPDDPMPPKRLRWAFFESLTRFRVETVNPKLPDRRIVSILALEGLAWKLVDVDIVKK